MTRLLAVALLFPTGQLFAQSINTQSFHKVIISPFIEASFVPANREHVVVNQSVVEPDKLHVEAKNGTLRIYLEGAREIPHDPRHKNSGTDYPAGAVTVTVYYRELDGLSLRGEEHFAFNGSLSADRFYLKLYGEPVVNFAEVNINDLRTTIYGSGAIEMQSGSVNRQSHICYGEGKINASAVSGEEARLTAYGEAEFHLNVSERIKISSFGESRLRYRGNPQIVKGIRVGDVDIAKAD